MLNCIIATILPKSGMNRPSTPASFMRRSTVSASFFEVRMSRNSRLASSSSRSLRSISLSERVASVHRVGMECQVVLLRQMEDADQVDRIALEHLVVGDVDAVVVDDEIVGLG